MSAWFMAKSDIDLLVSGLRNHKVYIPFEGGFACANGIDPVKLGQMLWEENRKSLEYRYPDHPDENAAYSKAIEAYRFHSYDRVAAGPLAKLAACYDYQSCEHDDWHTSDAREAMNCLRDKLVEMLPGYQDAPWGTADNACAIRKVGR